MRKNSNALKLGPDAHNATLEEIEGIWDNTIGLLICVAVIAGGLALFT